ncbi:sodium channel protein Nach-like [Pectinophora gossypiella]|uniref:sodium channel protein Nach-like n=1 Tax=Pectinophora gossypiella TaxID=13191 RepID=UPI00214EF277|nr:sodium channel protein Nach-like [Pectinophora gossypiella]
MDYFNWNVSYPAFTLCPAPSFKVDVTAFTELINKTDKRAELLLWAIILGDIENLELIDVPPNGALSLIDPRDYAKIAASVFKVFDESSITTNTNSPISVEPAMTELGMCHVVNSNVAFLDNPNKWGSNVTTYAKNNIQLSVHDRDFFTQIINYAEIYKVFIHGSDETILSTSPSYSQSLRGFMSFGVQVWTTKISEELRLAPMRLRKCRFISEPISERYPIYTYNHCLLECRIQMIIKLCGCIPHFYKPLDYERVCSIDELKCVLSYRKEILSLSTSEKTLKSFKTSTALPRTSKDCNCPSQCETDVYQKDYENFIPQKDMNWLRIGISSFPKVRVVRDIIFSFYDIMLRIGGVVNLCIGCSILSLVEMCVTTIRLCFI